MQAELRNVTKNERTGARGKELTCPHCKSSWLAGHLNWVVFNCTECKLDVHKYDWLCARD